MLLNYCACVFSQSDAKEKIVSRLIASMALLAVMASLTGCVVAPAYDYGYAQPYYPGYGYAYGPPYAPVYGSVGIYGGWGSSCCYYHGGYWHGGHGWHGGNGGHGGGWHGGGYGGYHGGGSSWGSSGGHGGGHGH
ncbi:putative glycine-rich protein [Paraburkholderia xenovorans LB400]|jgi:hypothetical protein|uniref:Glycine-rich protein n=1 Tax=Paraburkholderia xenovorans (strain LB400) TaxID=266265 RepID=Q13ZK0_PARXL|nr:glycine-rich protein [Paraburkholderia xenovorans LB400]AIP29874.1 putative glycine-rich protein [Paraburkholderia xenovorans LB400]